MSDRVDKRDALIKYVKLHDIGKIYCKIYIPNTNDTDLDIENISYTVSDTTGATTSKMIYNTIGSECDFIFDFNDDAEQYFVMVNFSRRNMSKQYSTFVFISKNDVKTESHSEKGKRKVPGIVNFFGGGDDSDDNEYDHDRDDASICSPQESDIDIEEEFSIGIKRKES